MASVGFQYRSKKDTAQIEVRFSFKDETQKFKSFYTRTQLEVEKDFFAEYVKGVNFRDKDKQDLRDEVNDLYKGLNSFIQNAYENESGTIDKDWLKDTVSDYYNPKPDDDSVPEKLLEYIDHHYNLKKRILSENSLKNIRNTQKVLIDYSNHKKKKYKVADVNQKFVDDFVLWMQDVGCYSVSAIEKHIAQLKAYYNSARKRGLQCNIITSDLEINVDEQETDIVYLTFDELDKIKNLTGLSESMDNIRDWLLISCYTGQRVSDFKRFSTDMIREEESGVYLDIKQMKTKKEVSIPLMPIVLEILQKRNSEFPRMISEQKYNKAVKEICKRAGINDTVFCAVKKKTEIGQRNIYSEYEKWEKISSHTGRRSFASNYYGIIPTAFLKNITGHKTEEMLLKYCGQSAKGTAEQSYQIMMKNYKSK